MKTSSRAFTLIEMLIVVAIIGMLATVLIKKFDVIFGDAEKQMASLYVKTNLRQSLESYRLHLGTYPSTSEGLAALLVAPAGTTEGWRGPYAEADGGKLPLDPWREPYQYRFPGTKNKTKYDLYSKGPDKTDGTEDDIGNW